MDDADPFRIAIACQVLNSANGNSYVCKTALLRPDVKVLRRGKPILDDVEAGRSVPKDHQPLGVLAWKRVQKQRIDNTEDRCVCADADGQRQDRGQGESRGLQEPCDKRNGHLELACSWQMRHRTATVLVVKKFNVRRHRAAGPFDLA